jgi:hypothetical protein
MSCAVKSSLGCKKIMKSALLLPAFFLFVVCTTAKADMNSDGNGSFGNFDSAKIIQMGSGLR